jgi:hypothetical protein
VTPAMVVCDHGEVAGWRLKELQVSASDEKRRLKRMCPFPLTCPLLKRHPHYQPSITRYEDPTHGTLHLILTKVCV